MIYFFFLSFVASPQYVSQFRVLVRNAGQAKETSLPQITGLTIPSSSNDNSYAVIQYIESQPAALALDRTQGLRASYSSGNVDLTSRLKRGATNYDFTKYWNHMLDAYFENTTNTIVVNVVGFDPRQAQRTAYAVLHLSEQLVNDMSKRSRQDLLAYAQNDVNQAQTDLRAIDAKIYALRNSRGIIDPRATATATLARQSRLQGEITDTQAEIATRRAYLSPGSPVMQLLTKRLAALEAGLASINSEAVLTSNGASEPLSSAINAFEALQADETFAQKQYQVALASLQSARAANAQQQLYLETVIPPTLPDEAAYPSILKNMAIFLVIAVALWAIAVSLIANIFERT